MITTIVAGDMTPDAKSFLTTHQVPTLQFQNLLLIQVDETIATIQPGEKPLEYIVAFWIDQESVDVEPDCIIVALSIDAAETKITLRKGYWPYFLTIPGKQVI